MMGPKKLSEIKQELKDGLTKAVGNPIQWLDERLSELEQQNKGKKRASTDVLQSLRRLFEEPTPAPKKRRKRKAARSKI